MKAGLTCHVYDKDTWTLAMVLSCTVLQIDPMLGSHYAHRRLFFALAGEACVDLCIHGGRGETPVHSGRSGDDARGGDTSSD